MADGVASGVMLAGGVAEDSLVALAPGVADSVADGLAAGAALVAAGAAVVSVGATVVAAAGADVDEPDVLICVNEFS